MHICVYGHVNYKIAYIYKIHERKKLFVVSEILCVNLLILKLYVQRFIQMLMPVWKKTPNKIGISV